MKNKKTPKVPKLKLEESGLIDTFTKTSGDNIIDINKLGLPDVSSSVYNKIKNNEDITLLFPDVELSIQILVSSILAPNDMTTTSLIINSPEIEIPNTVNNYILSVVKKHLNKEYKLEDKLELMLREALFTKGAYIEAIIPNSKLETIINTSGEVSLESLTKTYVDNNLELGILSTENMFEYDDVKYDHDDIFISITDNISLLGISDKYLDLAKEDLDATLYDNTLSTEADKFYNKHIKTKNVPVINIGDVEETETSSSKPTTIKMPTVSVMPIHIKSTPSEHIGYFVLLDESGAPITSSDNFNISDSKMQDLLYSNDVKSTMIKKAKDGLTGITAKDVVLKNVEDAYMKLTSQMLKNKLVNGKYGDTVDVVEDYDLYKIMFYRTLQNQKTRILYIPKEYMSYIAFDYRDNGTGRSMIEKVAMLFSIRSILLVSRLMANLKNSVTTTEVTATMDDNDPDPQATMEKIISETLKSRQTQIPIGINKVGDLVDWAHKVGFRYNFKGNGLPDMEVSVSDVGSSKIEPDIDLDERIQEYIIMSFGLTKDMVMAGFDPEYATIAVSNNILLAKRVMMLQNKFSAMLSEHITKLLRNDNIIVTAIENIVKDNIKAIRKTMLKSITDKELLKHIKQDKNLIEFVVNAYIKHITISFPKPEVTETTNMKDAYDNYVDTIDDVLDTLISSDAIPSDISGDISDTVDSVKDAMKTMLVKEWTINNNYLPELTEFLTIDNTGKPVFDIMENYNVYLEQLSGALIPYFKKNKKFTDKLNDKLSKIEEGEADEEDNTDDSNTNDTGGDAVDDNTDESNVDSGNDGGAETDGTDGVDDTTDDELNIDNIE